MILVAQRAPTSSPASSITAQVAEPADLAPTPKSHPVMWGDSVGASASPVCQGISLQGSQQGEIPLLDMD